MIRELAEKNRYRIIHIHCHSPIGDVICRLACRKSRNEFGTKLTSDNFVFMSAGELSVRKNHEVAIRAFAEIEEPGARYLIVGLGELEAKLKNQAGN